MGIKSYRPARNRRVAQPGTRGGVATGIIVASLDLRTDAGEVLLLVHEIGLNGETEYAQFSVPVGGELPTEGITIKNLSDPGSPGVMESATLIGPGNILLVFTEIAAIEAVEIVIQPMNPGWGNPAGAVFSGLVANAAALP